MLRAAGKRFFLRDRAVVRLENIDVRSMVKCSASSGAMSRPNCQVSVNGVIWAALYYLSRVLKANT